MYRLALTACFMVVCAFLGTPLAYAQSTRTWISGIGDDANPCTRLAPCKTFSAAFSKTVAGGEITTLDPGNFGTITITKSIILSSDNTSSAILSAGTDGIVVQAGTGDMVILRNISVNGTGSGQKGVKYLSGDGLVIERCSLAGFTQQAIDMNVSNGGNLTLSQVSISDAATGVRISGTGFLAASLDRVSIQRTDVAIDAVTGTTQVNNSIITQNTGYGVFSEGGEVNVERSMLTNNGIAVQAQTGGKVRLSDNGIYNNLTPFGCGGGIVASAGNNRTAANKGGATSCGFQAVVKVK